MRAETDNHRVAIGADIDARARVVACSCGWSRLAGAALAPILAADHRRYDITTAMVRSSNQWRRIRVQKGVR